MAGCLANAFRQIVGRYSPSGQESLCVKGLDVTGEGELQHLPPGLKRGRLTFDGFNHLVEVALAHVFLKFRHVGELLIAHPAT